ncbi:MAG: Multimodular transpeptidase-transglycosylase, partial [uncultured Frankineae bacterium]
APVVEGALDARAAARRAGVGRGRPGARGRRLRPHRDPRAQRRLDRCGRPHPVRRPLRDGTGRCAEPHPGVPGRRARARAARGPGRRGPALLHRAGHQPARHRPGAAHQRARRRGRAAGRIHHHAAVRQERLPHRGPHLQPQGPGGLHRAEDVPHAGEGPDPRGLPQHDLLGSPGLRDRRRRADLLRHRGRLHADRLAGGGPGRHHPQSGQLRPRRGPRAGAGALGVRARRDGRAGLALGAGAGRAGLPRGAGARAGAAQQRPVGTQGPRHPPGAGRAGPARLRRRPAGRRRSRGRDDDPPGGAGGGRGGRAGGDRHGARRGRPAGGARVGAAGHGRGVGLLRRRHGHRLRLRQEQRQRPAARFHLQAVRPRDRALAGDEPGHAARRQHRQGVPRAARADRELRRPVVGTGRSRRVHPPVGQHGVRPARARGRHRRDCRDRARRRHPRADPPGGRRRHRGGGHRAGQLRGAGPGPGRRLRDLRQPGRPRAALPGASGPAGGRGALRGPGRVRAGRLQRGRRRGCDVRHGAGDPAGHRSRRPAVRRSGRRRQDRHQLRQPRRVVRGLHPAAVDGGVARLRRPEDDPGRRGRGDRRRSVQQHLEELHGPGPRGAGGGRAPGAGLRRDPRPLRRRAGPRAVDHRTAAAAVSSSADPRAGADRPQRADQRAGTSRAVGRPLRAAPRRAGRPSGRALGRPTRHRGAPGAGRPGHRRV